MLWEDRATRSLGQAVAWWVASDAQGLSAWLLSLRSTLSRLAEHPFSGRALRGDPSGEIREAHVTPYRLIYRVRTDDLLILDITHLRRERPPLSLVP